MYPDFSYLMHGLVGSEPDNWLSVFKTFGFFLAIAFLVSAVVYYLELRRKARQGFFTPVRATVVEGKPATATEIAMNGLLGLILRFYVER